MRSLKSRLRGLGLDIKFVRPWKRAEYLGLRKSHATDVFMCSYPRSGNTWTRLILSCLVSPGEDRIDLDLIDRLVPECGCENALQTHPRLFKEHTPKFHLFPRVVYNVRDGRDCIVSAYRYACDALDYDRPFREFIVDRQAQIFGFWHEHVGQALAYQAKYPDRICMVRYEDLREKPIDEIIRIGDFIGKRPSREEAERIVELTNLTRQKQASYDDPRKAHTLRRGRVGGWREDLTGDDLLVFEGMASRVMDALGYERATGGDVPSQTPHDRATS